MKERPILFNAEMVRAILDGRKTQTRRVAKSQPHDTSEIECGIYHPTVIDRHGDEDAGAPIFGAYSMDGEWGCKCPYGQPGDKLWVRESFYAWGHYGNQYKHEGRSGETRKHFFDRTQMADKKPLYPATDSGKIDRNMCVCSGNANNVTGYWLRPSIHMPRWASRITLEIVSVRVERLCRISEQDALAEGANCTPFAVDQSDMPDGCAIVSESHRHGFIDLWESINGNGSWQQNPWVWVVEFKRVKP